MSHKSPDHPVKSLQSHLKMLLNLVEAEASARQVRQLPHSLETLERQVAEVQSLGQYRQVAKKIFDNAARIFGVKSAQIEKELDSIALARYWLNQCRNLDGIQTHYGKLTPGRRLTQAQCLDYLKVFSASLKDKPRWMDDLSRSWLMILKQGILSATAPILPLQEADLTQFWSEVESLLKTWRAEALIKELRGKKIRINHQYRQQNGNNIQFMFNLIQEAGFTEQQCTLLTQAVAIAANAYIDQERLDRIWSNGPLRERLQTVISLAMGYKPLCINNSPGLQNIWWFEGDRINIRGMFSGHPVPDDISLRSEKVRQAQMNIEQMWEVIAPPPPSAGAGGLTVPIVVQSLHAACWPDVDGNMDRSAILQAAVDSVEEGYKQKGVGHHQPDFWLVSRPTGANGVLSTMTCNRKFQQMIGQKAIKGTQIWSPGSLEYDLLLAAGSRYEKIHDEVFSLLAAYQAPFIGTIRSRVAYLSNSQTLKSKMMMLISLEQIILGLSDGICVTICEDGLERSVSCLVHTQAMMAFFEKYKVLPHLGSRKDRQRFANLFAQVMTSQWPQKLAVDANPGKRLLPFVSDLPNYLLQGFKPRQKQWLQNHRMRLKLPFVSKPHHPAPMPILALLPSTFDLHGACHVPDLAPSISPLPTLPMHIPKLLLLNAASTASGAQKTAKTHDQQLSTSELPRTGMAP